ncbi:MAG: hypothetical protein J0I81_13535 [Hyphomicrobium sp.]|nr:hypothetical protein [Hyphomicrobium sp.]
MTQIVVRLSRTAGQEAHTVIVGATSSIVQPREERGEILFCCKIGEPQDTARFGQKLRASFEGARARQPQDERNQFANLRSQFAILRGERSMGILDWMGKRPPQAVDEEAKATQAKGRPKLDKAAAAERARKNSPWRFDDGPSRRPVSENKK